MPVTVVFKFKFTFKLPTVIRSRDSEDSPSSPNGALIKIPAVLLELSWFTSLRPGTGPD